MVEEGTERKSELSFISFNRLHRFIQYLHFKAPKLWFPNSVFNKLPEQRAQYRAPNSEWTTPTGKRWVPFFVAFLYRDSAQPRQIVLSPFGKSQQFRVESSVLKNAVLHNSNSKISNSALLSPLYHPPQSFKTQLGFTLACRTCRSSANAWCSWRSRNWSSMSWSKVGRKRSVHSWQAQAGPRSLAAHQHLQQWNWDNVWLWPYNMFALFHICRTMTGVLWSNSILTLNIWI